MLKKLLVLLLLSPLCSCAAAVLGVGAGVLLTNEVLDDQTFVAQVQTNSDHLWSAAKNTLAKTSAELVEVDEALRRAAAKIDGSTVVISVETYDLQRSKLKVRATKLGVPNSALAEEIQNLILRELN